MMNSRKLALEPAVCSADLKSELMSAKTSSNRTALKIDIKHKKLFICKARDGNATP